MTTTPGHGCRRGRRPRGFRLAAARVLETPRSVSAVTAPLPAGLGDHGGLSIANADDLELLDPGRRVSQAALG